MNDLKECAVIIPIYKTELNNQEKISLYQVCNVLKDFDCIVVAPADLDLMQHGVWTRVERFDNGYFMGISSYNRLMLSPEFYKRFQQYEYILIYQLDAFVFEDKLSYFCDLGYDYIGAPWLHGMFNYIDEKHCVWHVGNGGLSLRKVSSFIELLEERNPLADEQIKNEDLFYSSIISEKFRVAPLEVALRFAFERQVEQCYERNHKELPFGCHAWGRCNPQFWKKHIEKYGYTLSVDYENSGGEDSRRYREYQVYSALSSFLEQSYDTKVIRNRLIEVFGYQKKGVLIFGAGFYGRALSRWLSDVEVSIVGFCDNNRELVGRRLQGHAIYRIDEMPFAKEDICIVIANYEHEGEMANQLEELLFERKKDYITFTDFVELLTGEL